MNNVIFDIAEVLAYDYTYQYIDASQADTNINQLFALKVRSCGENSYFNKKTFIVKPGNINIKKIPLIGEYVLIYKSFGPKSTSENWKDQIWYYLDVIDIKSSINSNSLPGISTKLTDSELQNISPGKTFEFKSVSPLQPYEGDILIEGRFGNSIRFSNTIKTGGNYYLNPSWYGTANSDASKTDPIIILSNRPNNKKFREFVVEDIRNDASSLYLTSTQRINNLQLGTSDQKNSLSCFWPNESEFSNSQFVGVADRVILKAKTDIAVIDSPLGIVLNTTGQVKLGSDDASESMVHGDVLLNILQKIINQLQMPITVKGNEGTFSDNAAAASAAQRQFNELLSSTYFIKKNTY
jgi:hypothetical protein